MEPQGRSRADPVLIGPIRSGYYNWILQAEYVDPWVLQEHSQNLQTAMMTTVASRFVITKTRWLIPHASSMHQLQSAVACTGVVVELLQKEAVHRVTKAFSRVAFWSDQTEPRTIFTHTEIRCRLTADALQPWQYVPLRICQHLSFIPT